MALLRDEKTNTLLVSDRTEVYDRDTKQYLGRTNNLYKTGVEYTAERNLSIGEDPSRGYSMFDTTDNNPFGIYIQIPKNARFTVIKYGESNLIDCTAVMIKVENKMKQIYNLFYTFPILDEEIVEDGGNVTYTVVYKEDTWERTFQVEKKENGDVFLRQSQYDARKWGRLTEKANDKQKEILQLFGNYFPIAPTEEKMFLAFGKLVPNVKINDYSISPFDSQHLYAQDGENMWDMWELIADKEENIFLLKNGTNVPIENQLKIRNILK